MMVRDNHKGKSDILIVDDTLPNLKVLSDMLQAEGYYVRGATSGRMALVMVKALPPDLMLLDVRMPEMDGYELCRKLKADEATRHIPVIFISALDELKDKVRGFKAGGVDYLTKPFQLEEVLARIKTHLRIRNLQRELETARKSAEAANQAKSRFLANMSHEIRTPMTAIMGFTALALKNNPDAQQLNYLKKIKRASDALLEIINDVLDFSKIEAGKLQMASTCFCPETLIEEVAEMFSGRAAEKGLKLIFKSGPGIPRQLIGDPGRIRQVLVNLMGNAFKFTSAGEITIRIARAREAEKTLHLFFSVSDTGIGIPEADVSRIFSPFSQLDDSTTRQYAGTGLGLAICKQMVKLMNGGMKVESRPGEGSTFSFSIPFEKCKEEDDPDEMQPKEAESREEGHVPELKGRRVLVTDDEEINREVVVNLLDVTGVRADMAGNGREALEAVCSKHYDAVLLDIGMPEMDGYTAAKEIKKIYPELPVIAMTGHAFTGDREKCLAAGMDDYISKPIDPDRLYHLLCKWTGAPAEAPCSARLEAETLPPLPGLETPSALRRLGGDVGLYIKLLKGFAEKWRHLPDQMQAALSGRNMEMIQARAHALKGVAGNISATALYSAAFELEKKAVISPKKGAPDVKEVETAIRRVAASLAQVLESVKTLDNSETRQSARADVAAPPPGEDEIGPILARLSEALASHDPGAEEIMESCLDLLLYRNMEDECRELESRVRQFDFKAARQTLQKIFLILGM